MIFKLARIALAAAIGATFSACADNGANSTASNSNAAPAPPGPSVNELVARDTAAFQAVKTKDKKFFEDFLADGYVSIDSDGIRDKAITIKEIAESTCEAKSFTVADELATALGGEAALLTYKASGSFECDGKEENATTWAATVFVKAGDTWKSAYHNEVPIADPNAEPAESGSDLRPPPPPKTKSAPKDPLTVALLAVETRGWEAWKNKDGKTLDEITAKDLTVIDGSGRADKAAALKKWSEQNCEIKEFSLSYAKAVPLGANAALLTYFAAVDGKCDGAPAASVWGTSVYVRDGENWKVALILETAG